MGTKLNPGEFDCYQNALPDEPMFILLARDQNFSKFVIKWASQRYSDILCGERPYTDIAIVNEAYNCANDGQKWRRENNGIWRKK